MFKTVVSLTSFGQHDPQVQVLDVTILTFEVKCVMLQRRLTPTESHCVFQGSLKVISPDTF